MAGRFLREHETGIVKLEHARDKAQPFKFAQLLRQNLNKALNQL